MHAVYVGSFVFRPTLSFADFQCVRHERTSIRNIIGVLCVWFNCMRSHV